MCGIAGYKLPRKIDTGVLEKMLAVLYHRGPDSQGHYRSGEYTAGMRRLIINDLKTGDQPLFNADHSVVLLYNGEIYNSPELRRELESKGYRFSTHSDGEVICHLYAEYKEHLFEYLDGMFAVALWIVSEKKLILARDIPGEKPLYFSRLPEGGIVFASEIKCFKFFPGLELELDVQGLWDYPTFLWIPEPKTVYRSVEALLPGHVLIAQGRGITIEQFKRKPSFSISSFNSEEDLLNITRQLVEKAVSSRLLSDVPVGCFLSSGLDSSLVTTIARRNLESLSTFTIGFENLKDSYHGLADESVYAEYYAKKLGTKHTTIRVVADDFLKVLDDFCVYGDQPFAVSSGLGLLLIAKRAHEEGVKVLLSGDGADECFGGYSWYEYLSNHQGSGSLAGLNDVPDSFSFQNFGVELYSRLKRLYSYSSDKQAWAWHYYASEEEKKSLYSPEYFEGCKSSLRYFTKFNSSKNWSSEEYIRHDRYFYLPNEMLKKVDRMTMAYSVEGRTPFVSPDILSFAEGLKYSQCVRQGTLKWLLRKAFADLLPDEVITRPKHGFNVPIDHWLKDRWSFLIDETFSSDSALFKRGIISKGSLDIAKKMLYDKERLKGHTLFTFIMFNRWLERCI